MPPRHTRSHTTHLQYLLRSTPVSLGRRTGWSLGCSCLSSVWMFCLYVCVVGGEGGECVFLHVLAHLCRIVVPKYGCTGCTVPPALPPPICARACAMSYYHGLVLHTYTHMLHVVHALTYLCMQVRQGLGNIHCNVDLLDGI